MLLIFNKTKWFLNKTFCLVFCLVLFLTFWINLPKKVNVQTTPEVWQKLQEEIGTDSATEEKAEVLHYALTDRENDSILDKLKGLKTSHFSIGSASYNISALKQTAYAGFNWAAMASIYKNVFLTLAIGVLLFRNWNKQLTLNTT